MKTNSKKTAGRKPQKHIEMKGTICKTTTTTTKYADLSIIVLKQIMTTRK